MNMLNGNMIKFSNANNVKKRRESKRKLKQLNIKNIWPGRRSKKNNALDLS